MIVGVSHISFNVENFDDICKEHNQKEFECEFIEKEIMNHQDKKSVLSSYQPVHNIGLFKSKNVHVSIEVTDHGIFSDNEKGPYENHLDKVVLKTSDIQKEKKFWKNAMKFKGTDTSNQIEFKSILSKWSIMLELQEDKRITPCYLNSEGHTCLAFVSNDVTKDLEVMKYNGAYDICGPFKLVVNQKEIKIVLARSVNGALIELIQV